MNFDANYVSSPGLTDQWRYVRYAGVMYDVLRIFLGNANSFNDIIYKDKRRKLEISVSQTTNHFAVKYQSTGESRVKNMKDKILSRSISLQCPTWWYY